MKREKVLEAILAITAGLVVLAAVLHARALAGAAVVVAAVGLFVRPLASVIARVWMKLAEGIGFVTSRILLAAVFFIVLVPVALLRRLATGRHLQLKRPPGATCYIERNHRCVPKDLENIW